MFSYRSIKRLSIIALIAIMLLCCVGCGTNNDAGPSNTETEAVSEEISGEELLGTWEAYGHGQTSEEVEESAEDAGKAYTLVFHGDYTVEVNQNGADLGALYWTVNNEEIYIKTERGTGNLKLKASLSDEGIVAKVYPDGDYVFMKKTADSDEELAETEPAAVGAKHEVTGSFSRTAQGPTGLYYNAYVEITNTGDTNLYLKDCVFDLEDANGHLLASDNHILASTNVIRPGEKGYFYNMVGAAHVSDDVLENFSQFSYTYEVVEAIGADTTSFVISDTDTHEDSHGFTETTGRITNPTTNDYGMFLITVIYYGADEKPIYIAGVYSNGLAAGETQSFNCYQNRVSIDEIASYEVVARPLHTQI